MSLVIEWMMPKCPMYQGPIHLMCGVQKLDGQDLVVKILGKFYYVSCSLLICSTVPVSITFNNYPIFLITSLSKLFETLLPGTCLFCVLCFVAFICYEI